MECTYTVIRESDLIPISTEWTSTENVYGDLWGYKIYNDPNYDHPDAAIDV